MIPFTWFQHQRKRRLGHSAEMLALVRLPDEEDLERMRPTGRAVSLEFRGRTEILHVRDSAWASFRVNLGVLLFRAGQRLMGVRVGKGRLVFKHGKVIEL